MYFLSSFLIRKFPSLEKYKPGVEFLARLFFLLVLSLLAKKFYWLISDRGGTLTIAPFRGFNLIETLRTSIIDITKFVLSSIGHSNAVSYGWIVGLADGGAISIQTPCIGINVCLVFIGLILAYPKAIPVWKVGLFAVIGLVIIQTINILRMVGMIYVVRNRYTLPIDHHDLFNIVVYSAVIGMFYYYMGIKETASK